MMEKKIMDGNLFAIVKSRLVIFKGRKVVLKQTKQIIATCNQYLGILKTKIKKKNNTPLP